MNNPYSWVDRSMGIITHLSCKIGPRPSGSQAERDAQEFLAEILRQSEYSCRFEAFTFPSIPGFFPYYSLPGILFILSAFLPGTWRTLLMGMPFLVGGLTEIYAWLTGFLPQRSQSQNLIATPADVDQSQLDVLLCAHADTGKMLPHPSRGNSFIHHNLWVILELLSWVAAFLGVAQVAIPLIAEAISPLSKWILLICGLLFIWIDVRQQLFSGKQISPGANDNASGAALATALAEQFHRQSNHCLKIGVLITGAEEAGLYGARAYVDRHPRHVAGPVVINLDMVASGHRIGSVTRTGRLKPIYTDEDLNSILRSMYPRMISVDYRYRGGDFIPFLRKGYRVLSLEATDSGGVPPTYHSQEDTMDHIQSGILQQIGELVLSITTRSVLEMHDK